jgi:hypothetical protein
VPDVSILGDGTFRVAFGVADATALVAGGNRSLSPPERLDDGTSTAPGDPKVTVGRGGGAVTAWKVSRGNATGVVTREDPSGGRPSQVASLAGTVGGGIADLDVAGSGLGDALVAFRAGSGTNGQIAAAAVDAPPSSFNVNTPIGFVRPIRAEIGWDAAPDAFGGVTYSVVIDGQVRATGLAGTSYRPPIDGLSDGTYPVYVIATDAAGQQTASTHGDLQVDGTPPTATVTARKRTAIVRVRDGTARQSAGVATARTRVFWGDGKSTKADRTSQRHRYKRRGRYRVVVKTADTAGNRARIGNTARVR